MVRIWMIRTGPMKCLPHPIACKALIQNQELRDVGQHSQSGNALNVSSAHSIWDVESTTEYTTTKTDTAHNDSGEYPVLIAH